MRLCNKKDDNWLTALMLDADAFGGCSEDGVERHKMKTYVRNMLSRPDLVVLTPAPGKMIHTFHRKNAVMHEIHTAIRLGCDIPGKERVRLTRETCEWMIKHRGARKFITHVPEGPRDEAGKRNKQSRAAGLYAIACGLEWIGVITKSIKRNGILLDMALYQSRDEDIQEVVRSMSCR